LLSRDGFLALARRFSCFGETVFLLWRDGLLAFARNLRWGSRSFFGWVRLVSGRGRRLRGWRSRHP
jgi:hypothetical protein